MAIFWQINKITHQTGDRFNTNHCQIFCNFRFL